MSGYLGFRVFRGSGSGEHAISVTADGVALYDPGMIPYCATFFIFTGARPLRLP